MGNLLDLWDKENKYKQVKHCHEKWKNSPFVLLLNGMLGKEALAVLTNLSQLMAEKLKEPISHIRGWVNVCIKIAVASSYS